MSLTEIALIVCLCLASLILGMIIQAIILHPHRAEVKRTRKRLAAEQEYRQRMQRLNR
jgi:hypothetical protein